ncbi:amidohydrolase family protein [Arsenicicoccus piscis]|uniref:amidohydrolase n=1 Tax=Arsenicicoccus piscis TaxID=673954 RepID=UPI001F4D161F|nr:amidohydrolase family protein [Arsenicicoccus piscis]
MTSAPPPVASAGVATGTSVLVRDVRVVDLETPSDPALTPVDVRIVDVRIVDGIVREVGPHLARRGAEIIDGGGRFVIPGLWDQHVHLGQWALSTSRLDTSGTRSPEDACAIVAAALPGLPPGATLQGWGHRSATWTRAPGTADLDAVAGDRPVVLISGDGHHGWLSSRAQRLLGLEPRPGVIAEAEWFALFPRLIDLPGVGQTVQDACATVVSAANARGVTGIVDLEWVDGPPVGTPPAPRASGAALRVRRAVYEAGLEEALAHGLRTGELLPGSDGLVTMGPFKIISDGSLNTRTAYCCTPYTDATPIPGDEQHDRGVQNVPLPALTSLLSRAHAGGLQVALHAIGDAAVADALQAFEATGARGTVEHAQLMAWSDVDRMARLGIAASVQPAHLWDDRDVTMACWADRAERCFPLRSLLDAGVDVRLGSDAPVSPLDPWLAMAAAVHRSADDRPPWHPEQALTVAEALSSSTDGVRGVEVGGPGDLVLLETNPLAAQDLPSGEAAAALQQTGIVATLVAGRVVHAS